MPKVAFKKCDVITFTCFFGHCTAKNKDIALKFCMRVVCMYLGHIYSGFLITWKFRILWANIFEKSKFWIFGVKIETNIKIPRWAFCRAFNFTLFGVFRLRLPAKLNILAAFKQLLFFDPTLRNMTSLKRHFLQKLSTDFSEILLADIKLMLKKVLKVWRRYLLQFLSYRENPTGGDIRPPPQRGAG